MKLTAASPSPTCASDASDHSMDRPIMFKQGKNLGTSPTSTCASVTSDHSMDRILFNLRMNLRTASPASTCASFTSDHSLDRPMMFKNGEKQERPSPAPTCISMNSNQSMDRPIMFSRRGEGLGESSASLLIESHFRGPVCSEQVSPPRDRCYCKTCIQIYWTNPTLLGSNSSVKQPKCSFVSSDVTSDFVEVAALGRPLDLGMLYDCRNDSFNPDVFLWDVSTVSSMRLSFTRPHTDVRILEEDSLQDRLSALDLTTPLRASVVSGLVEVSGAAAFLKHPTQSQRQDRVTLHHRTSTRLDMLSHRLLQNGAPLPVNSQNSATHVVVAVLYGAQAFVSFDHETESCEGSRELKATVSKMVTCSCAADLLSSLSESEQASCVLYKCALYADAEGIKSPVDFKTAVNLFSSHQRVFGPQREKEVPLKVWLLPLKDLTETSAHVLKEISEDLLLQAETVLEYLDFLKKELGFCTDMMSDCSGLHGVTWFVALKDTLSQFSLLLKQYRAAFRRRLASSITTIREKGEEGEESLRELLRKNGRSPFGPQNMYRWLRNKDAEVRALIECRAAKVITVKSAEDLEHIIRHTQAERVLCFTLTSLEGEERFLSALKRHVDFLNMDNIQETQPPFRLPNVSQKIMSDLRSFLFTREAEECAEKTQFLAASAPEERYPGSCIRLYHTGMIVSDNLKIDAKPAPAQIITVKPTRVTLRLQSSEMTCADRYRVEYKAADCGGEKNIMDAKWRATEIWRNASDYVFLDGKPETQYQLRYALMDDNSMSDYSRITEFQTLPRARPGQPAVLKQNRHSLTVSWQRAETDGDAPVLRYMVEYMEAGLEGWLSVLTEGPECSVTFSHSTCYKLRVSAVYEEGDTSKPSEETEVLLDAWSINSSARDASLFLELQTEEKPELRGQSDEESEVRSFLQCTAQLRLSKETLQQLLVVFKAQDEELTCCFLKKVDGDLSACSLNWEMIQYFLQYHTVTAAVNFNKLLTVLDRVQLRRLLLLRLLHCCSVSELQQGAAAALLSALQHRLDFSCSSSLDLTEHTQKHTLSTEDCRVISMIIQRALTHTQLILQDCEIEEAGLEQLFTVLHTVTLDCSKALLLPFLVATEALCLSGLKVAGSGTFSTAGPGPQPIPVHLSLELLLPRLHHLFFS